MNFLRLIIKIRHINFRVKIKTQTMKFIKYFSPNNLFPTHQIRIKEILHPVRDGLDKKLLLAQNVSRRQFITEKIPYLRKDSHSVFNFLSTDRSQIRFSSLHFSIKNCLVDSLRTNRISAARVGSGSVQCSVRNRINARTSKFR